MQDLVVKGTGNSRTLKSSVPAGTTWEQALAMFQAGTFPVDLNGLNANGIQVMGTPYSKGAVLPDDVLTKIGLPTSSEPKDMFGVLADVGKLHVWKKVVTHGTTTDYPVSTQRNAYPDSPSYEEIAARWELGEVVSGTFLVAPKNASATVRMQYSDSVVVSADGSVSLSNPYNIDILYSRYDAVTNADELIGKFVRRDTTYNSSYANDFSDGNLYFIPSDATVTRVGSYDPVTINKRQPVFGYPAIPADTQYTYLGPLGAKSQVQVLSYVGTGTYGKSNKNSLTFDFTPKIIAILGTAGERGFLVCGSMGVAFVGLKSYSYYGNIISTADGNTVSWYNSESAGWQLNTSNTTFTVTAIG